MPCYNSERALAATLTTLAQTFAAYEVVTVNDGSIDETQAILKRYAPPSAAAFGSSPRRMPVRLPPSARSKPHAASVALLDSDDLWSGQTHCRGHSWTSLCISANERDSCGTGPAGPHDAAIVSQQAYSS
jgi:hypothetical protein